MYEVLVSHVADKYYKKQDRDTKRRINKCIDNLSQEPLFGPHIKKLHGELEGKHRYEVGGIRIVYEVNTKSKTVEIKAIEVAAMFIKDRFLLSAPTDNTTLAFIPLGNPDSIGTSPIQNVICSVQHRKRWDSIR